jgi:hypothetical protein
METAIAQLPNHEQDDIRFRAGHNIKQLYKQQSHNKQHNSNHDKKERSTLSQIKNKLATNRATVFKEDKGNSAEIMYLEDYNNNYRTSSTITISHSSLETKRKNFRKEPKTQSKAVN